MMNSYLFETSRGQFNWNKLDVHGPVHHNTDLIEMTNKMQLCRTINYSIVP